MKPSQVAKVLESMMRLGEPVYLWGPPGCLASYTKLKYETRGPDGNRRGRKGGSIERLYQIFNRIPSPGKGRYQQTNHDSTFWLQSVDGEGRIFKNQVLGVIYSGQKECFRLITEKGLEIDATADHKFLSNGQYVPISELSIGDSIEVHLNKIINNSSSDKKRLPRKHVFLKNHPYARTQTVEDKYIYKVLPLSRAVVEADMNGLTLQEYKDRVNTGDFSNLKFLNPNDDVHHLDENCQNNDLKNLEVISHAEHARKHGLQEVDLRFITESVRIVSIEPVGVRDTYDVQMADPYNNFVANKFVVHNCSKSSLVKQAAERIDLPVIDIRAVLLDPVDLRGIPYVKDRTAHWAPPSFLPREGKGIVFLDELVNAPPMVQSALLQLVLDRRIGEYQLPDGWRFVAASNRVKDRAGSHKIISSLANRFACHIDVEVDHGDWHLWALNNGIAPDVRAFMTFRPALLSQFDPNSDDPAFPTPRSWEFASKIVLNTPNDLHLQALQGTVGKGPAGEFIAFRDVYMSLPNPADVIRDPENAPISKDPATLYAIVGSMTEESRKRPKEQKALRAISTYINRLPAAFGAIFFKDVSIVAPMMTALPETMAWVKKHNSLIQ